MSHRESLIASFAHDVRSAIRTLRRTPGFMAIAVVVLALAIGVNAAVFSIVNALLLRPLPVRAPEQLAFVYDKHAANPCCALDEITSWREERRLFSDLATLSEDAAFLGSGADTTVISGEQVSTNYFEMLGVKAKRGRTLDPSIDDSPDAPPVVVISDRLWRRQFGSDPNILGQTIALRREQKDSGWRYAIVGVTGSEFSGLISPWIHADFWVSEPQRTREFDNPSLTAFMQVPRASRKIGIAIGRRQPGVTIQQAAAFVGTRHAGYTPPQAFSVTNRDAALDVLASRRIELPLDQTGRVAPDRLATAIMVVAGLVLLIGLSNLVGVTVARTIVRKPEIAVRLTLGASRGRLGRELVIEGLVLALVGGLGGLVICQWLVSAFLAGLPASFGSVEAPLDVRVWLFTVGVVVLVGAVVGLSPIREAAKTDLVASLKGTAEATPGRLRMGLRRLIVVPQVCICTALLLIAGVAVHTLLAVTRLELGYEPGGVGYVNVSLGQFTAYGGSKEDRQAAFLAFQQRGQELTRRILEIAQSHPGIRSAGVTDALPTAGNDVYIVLRDGFSDASTHTRVASARVTPSYFAAVGLPTRAGRLIEDRDSADAPKVVVIDEAIADRLWPSRSPIGQFMGFHTQGSTNTPDWLEVIGVVGSIRHPLSDGPTRLFIYQAAAQSRTSSSIATLVARGREKDSDVVRTLRAVVAQADPEAQVQGGRMLTESINAVRYPRLMSATLLISAALFGLILATLGLYGVVSYSVAQRNRELGIRAALGANRAALVRLVMREGVVIVAVGSLLGFALAVTGLRVASSQIFAMPALDPISAMIVPLILAGIVLVACYLPARRAARADPMVTLRRL